MGSTWSFLSKHAKRTGKDMRAFIREEVNCQEQIEADGYRSPSWRILRSLQKVYEALQGESAVTPPPFFRSAGRGERVFWGRGQGPTVFVWESLDANGKKRCEEVTRSTRRNWVVWSRTNPRRGRGETRACKSRADRSTPVGLLVFPSAACSTMALDFGVFAFLSFSLGPAGNCPCRH